MLCSVTECNLPIKARGLCEKHYARLLRTGTTDLLSVPRGSIDTCLVFGCTKPHRANGFCNTHYGYYRKTGSPYLPRIVRYCGVKGCDEKHWARGLCRKHYYQWKKLLESHNLWRY